MEQFARPPQELSSNGPMDVNWRSWKQQFEIFLKASDATKRSDEVKACLLMNLIGPVGQQAFQKFSFEEQSDSENLEILMKKFDDFFDPQKSEAHERYIFFTSYRKKGETLDQFITEMRVKARTCNFGPLTDSLIRDKIVLDVKDKTLRKHLLGEPELTLSQAILMCEAFDRTAERVNELCEGKKGQPQANEAKGAKVKSDAPTKQKPQAEGPFKNACWRCGTHHPIKQCPAHGKKCAACKEVNHYTQNCGKNPKAPRNNAQAKANAHSKNAAPGPFSQIPTGATEAWEMIEKISRDVSKNVAIRNLPNNLSKK